MTSRCPDCLRQTFRNVHFHFDLISLSFFFQSSLYIGLALPELFKRIRACVRSLPSPRRLPPLREGWQTFGTFKLNTIIREFRSEAQGVPHGLVTFCSAVFFSLEVFLTSQSRPKHTQGKTNPKAPTSMCMCVQKKKKGTFSKWSIFFSRVHVGPKVSVRGTLTLVSTSLPRFKLHTR